jgi:release factor glutamine methyltransferase
MKDTPASTVQDLLRHIREKLTTLYPEAEAGAMSQQVVEHVLQLSRLQLSLARTNSINTTDAEAAEAMLQRLLKHEPLQYVLGTVHFYGLELEVDERVLIPRPETEELVDLVIKEHSGTPGLQILDICTGSGCIPLALAANLPRANVYGLELSVGALEVARANAAKYNLAVKWLQQDVFEPFTIIEPASLDIITSNPPYVLEEEKNQMRPNVLEFEPHLALFVPDKDALKYYRRIAEVGLSLLKKNGTLYLEINEKYGADVCALLLQAGFAEATVKQDMFGIVRMVRAVR